MIEFLVDFFTTPIIGRFTAILVLMIATVAFLTALADNAWRLKPRPRVSEATRRRVGRLHDRQLEQRHGVPVDPRVRRGRVPEVQ